MRQPTSFLVLLALAGLAAAQERPGRIEGQVLGPLGKPLANVEVWTATGARTGDVLAKTRTDAEGMFVLAQPSAAPAQVLARAPGMTTAIGYADLGPEKREAGLQLRLWDANTLRGRVADRDGKPVANALVMGTKDMTSFDGNFLPPEARTDADGRFELAGVPIGDCVLRAYHEQRAFRAYWTTALADGEVAFPPLVAEHGTTLRIGTEGLPAGLVARPKVMVHATNGGTGFTLPSAIERPELDANGRVELRGLPDAEWHVELDLPGFTFDPRSAATKGGERDHTLVFRATADGTVKLTGVLRSADGTPLADERLICRTKRSQSINGGRAGRATTGADGRFTMDAPLVDGEPFSLHLVNSRWVLDQPKTGRDTGTWDARYRARWEGQVELGRELALVAVAGAQVRAKIVDSEGHPVAFAWSELQVRRTRWTPEWAALAYATSSRTGDVTFPAVHGGDHELRITVNGARAAGSSEPFAVAEGKQRRLDVVLPLHGKVAGRMLDANGRPLAGRRISLLNYDVTTGQPIDGNWTNVPSDRDGRFVFPGVAAGGHRVALDLRIPNAGFPRIHSEVFDVAPGATVQIELRTK